MFRRKMIGSFSAFGVVCLLAFGPDPSSRLLAGDTVAFRGLSEDASRRFTRQWDAGARTIVPLAEGNLLTGETSFEIDGYGWAAFNRIGPAGPCLEPKFQFDSVTFTEGFRSLRFSLHGYRDERAGIVFAPVEIDAAGAYALQFTARADKAATIAVRFGLAGRPAVVSRAALAEKWQRLHVPLEPGQTGKVACVIAIEHSCAEFDTAPATVWLDEVAFYPSPARPEYRAAEPISISLGNAGDVLRPRLYGLRTALAPSVRFLNHETRNQRAALAHLIINSRDRILAGESAPAPDTLLVGGNPFIREFRFDETRPDRIGFTVRATGESGIFCSRNFILPILEENRATAPGFIGIYRPIFRPAELAIVAPALVVHGSNLKDDPGMNTFLSQIRQVGGYAVIRTRLLPGGTFDADTIREQARRARLLAADPVQKIGIILDDPGVVANSNIRLKYLAELKPVFDRFEKPVFFLAVAARGISVKAWMENFPVAGTGPGFGGFAVNFCADSVAPLFANLVEIEKAAGGKKIWLIDSDTAADAAGLTRRILRAKNLGVEQYVINPRELEFETLSERLHAAFVLNRLMAGYAPQPYARDTEGLEMLIFRGPNGSLLTIWTNAKDETVTLQNPPDDLAAFNIFGAQEAFCGRRNEETLKFSGRPLMIFLEKTDPTLLIKTIKEARQSRQ